MSGSENCSEVDDGELEQMMSKHKISKNQSHTPCFDCMHTEVQEFCGRCMGVDGDDDDERSETVTTSMSEVSLPNDRSRLPLGKNKSFTAFEVREIERNNANLVKKIATHNRRQSQYRLDTGYYNKVWNSQVNRKKKQQQIDRENMILLRKIQCVKGSGLSYWKK